MSARGDQVMTSGNDLRGTESVWAMAKGWLFKLWYRTFGCRPCLCPGWKPHVTFSYSVHYSLLLWPCQRGWLLLYKKAARAHDMPVRKSWESYFFNISKPVLSSLELDVLEKISDKRRTTSSSNISYHQGCIHQHLTLTWNKMSTCLYFVTWLGFRSVILQKTY